MPGVVVVGAQWGDEGKGKYVDWLAAQADWVVRHQGGNNAGHTVFVGSEQYILHLLPTGLIQPNARGAVGAGVVIDPAVLARELDDLRTRGIELTPRRLVISTNAHIIMPWHKLLDGLSEDRSKERKVGTTRRGIGPAYSDKVGRRGIRVADLVDPEQLARRIRQLVPDINEILTRIYDAEPIDAEPIIAEYIGHGQQLAPFVGDVSGTIHTALRQGRRVLCEGAQGTLLDIDFGTYPYVTSSNTIAAGACTGIGMAPHDVVRVLGVVKAYTTRVGEGPFPTEQPGEMGNRLRTSGPVGEFGATTGRPRRCGWFDAPLARRSVIVNGISDLAMTRLDVLTGLDEIPMCVRYNFQGKHLDVAPEDLSRLGDCEPVYSNMPGWREDLAEVRSWEQLPATARAYVLKIEELLGAPVAMVSVGPERSQTIVRDPELWQART